MSTASTTIVNNLITAINTSGIGVTATTVSTTSTTTMSFGYSQWHSITPKVMTMEDFFALEDKDLQKWAYKNCNIKQKTELVKINNDEKIAYYYITKYIKANQQGTFYLKQNLEQWISYNRKTKKVKISKVYSVVFNALIEEKFKYCLLFDKFVVKPTATLCKKIIEDKIRTLGDVMKYLRSYTLRSKDLKEETVYRFTVLGLYNIINVFEDPNYVAEQDNFKMTIDNINNEILANRPFKIKWDEISDVNKKYEQWNKEQSEKYDSFIRSRIDKDGYQPSKSSY